MCLRIVEAVDRALTEIIRPHSMAQQILEGFVCFGRSRLTVESIEMQTDLRKTAKIKIHMAGNEIYNYNIYIYIYVLIHCADISLTCCEYVVPFFGDVVVTSSPCCCHVVVMLTRPASNPVAICVSTARNLCPQAHW